MTLGPRRRVHRVPLCIVGVVLVAACGSGETSDQIRDSHPVLATTSIWADIVSQVACGATVPALIPPGADPHTFEPSLRDRQVVESSNTIISNGLGLEESLTDLLDAARDHDVDVIEMSNDIDVLATDDDHDDDQDDDQDDAQDEAAEHDHGGDGDPHVWHDPLRVAGTLDTIASALAASDVATCTDVYRAELIEIDAEIEATLDVVPSTSRVLVTSHDSLAYFADRYDFEIIGTVIPSTSTLAETNAADLAALAEVVERSGVPAIFTEEFESSADAEALARRLDVDVIPLVTDSLVDDPSKDSYVEMMRSNAAAIAAALAP